MNSTVTDRVPLQEARIEAYTSATEHAAINNLESFEVEREEPAMIELATIEVHD